MAFLKPPSPKPVPAAAVLRNRPLDPGSAPARRQIISRSSCTAIGTRDPELTWVASSRGCTALSTGDGCSACDQKRCSACDQSHRPADVIREQKTRAKMHRTQREETPQSQRERDRAEMETQTDRHRQTPALTLIPIKPHLPAGGSISFLCCLPMIPVYS